MRKIIVLFPMLVLSGCAYYQPLGVSSTNIGSQYERPIGMAEGTARRWEFFPCWSLCPTGEDTLKAALEDALEGTPGDTLANVYVDRRVIYFPHYLLPLIVRSDIIVTGTLVKYNTKEFPADNDQLINFRRVYKAEELWPKLLELDKEHQEKIVAHLSDTAKLNLQVFLESKESSKDIKEDSKESELFKIILKREIYKYKYKTPYDIAPDR